MLVIEIAEQWQATVLKGGRSVLVGAIEAGDVVVDQLGRGGVVADHDEAGRNVDAGFGPKPVGLFVVPVERFEGGLQSDGEFERIEIVRFAAALSWACRGGCVPRGCGTSAPRRRGCCRPRARAAA